MAEDIEKEKVELEKLEALEAEIRAEEELENEIRNLGNDEPEVATEAPEMTGSPPAVRTISIGKKDDEPGDVEYDYVNKDLEPGKSLPVSCSTSGYTSGFKEMTSTI